MDSILKKVLPYQSTLIQSIHIQNGDVHVASDVTWATQQHKQMTDSGKMFILISKYYENLVEIDQLYFGFGENEQSLLPFGGIINTYLHGFEG